MIQLFGKMLDSKKQVRIALTNISGLNHHQIDIICNRLKIGRDCKIRDLSQFHVINLLRLLETKNLTIEAALKKEVQSNVSRLIAIKSHRGLKSIRKKVS